MYKSQNFYRNAFNKSNNFDQWMDGYLSLPKGCVRAAQVSVSIWDMSLTF